jgi:hypothetical protein
VRRPLGGGGVVVVLLFLLETPIHQNPTQKFERARFWFNMPLFDFEGIDFAVA